MKFRWLCLLVSLAVLSSVPSSGKAAEPYLEFVQGLRNRGYYEYALLYLDQIEKGQNVPAKVRTLVPYERAITLLQSSRSIRSPDMQSSRLDRALAQLESFVKANPSHPKAGQANSERARILLGKGRVEVWQSRSPANQSQKAEHQKQARQFIAQARKIFQSAHDQHKAIYEKFPKFIDQKTQKQLFEDRRQAEVNYMRAQLDLAMTTYEEAQTHDVNAPEYKKISNRASVEFEEINSKYRSMVVGLYARLWQGKCFEEQGDLNRALGIYNELLGHPGKSKTMQRLQDQVRQFRLICLNHDDRKDYQLVIQEGLEWLKQAKGRSRSPIGRGIRWELARAQETMGMDRTLPKDDANRYLRQALANARDINRYPGQYKDVSMSMIRRLQVALRGKDAGDPEDFDTAYQLARNRVKQIKDLQERPKKETDPTKRAKLQEDLKLHLDETARLLNLALQLVDEKTEISQINQARYLLSYVYYLTGHSYESAILGEFVGRHYGSEDPKTAMDAAYLAMAAWVQAHNAAPKGQRDVEINMIARLCSMITTKWPKSDKADDARMRLGGVYRQRKQPVEAAKWYGQIPPTAARFADAQLAAGQAYWAAYLETAPLPDAEKPPVKDLKKWQAASEKHLRTGIEKIESQVPADGSPPEDLTAARVTLAQILINKGQDKDAIASLTGGKYPVVKAIAVKDGEQRPAKGIKSPEFAGAVYQLLLRGYVGTQQIDQALTAMDELEKVGESDSTLIYVQLGRELEKEIKRRQGLGDDEGLKKVRTAFETFLGELYNRSEGQTYGSLIWIAETYYGLGQGMGDVPSAAAGYFEKAANTYESIIELAKDKPDEVTAAKLMGVKLRLVNCKRRQGDFESALKTVKEVLTEKPRALDAQIEAAYVLQDWAGSGQPGSLGKFLDAINGTAGGEKKGVIWGWGQIALRLWRNLETGVKNPDFERKYLEARYNVSWCRHQYGKSQKKKQEIEAAEREILAFASVAGKIDEEWRNKFDTLYQRVQADLGKTPVPLPEPKQYEPVKPKVADTGHDSRSAGTTPQGPDTTTVAERAIPPPATPLWKIAAVIVGVLVLTAGLIVFMVKGSGTRRRVEYASTAPMPSTARRRSVKPKSQAGKTKSAKPSAKSRTGKTQSGKTPPKKPRSSQSKRAK